MKKIYSIVLIIFVSSLSWFVWNHKVLYNDPPWITPIEQIMKKPLPVLLQHIAPQRLLTSLAGWLGDNKTSWLKNSLIRYFVKRFGVNMSDAITEDPYQYSSFNEFFTRQLKPEKRPIVTGENEIASPVDGVISQIGKIHHNAILQAKNVDYTLKNLLGGSEKLAKQFEDGNFATFYLSPKDYHRVHMPLPGQLKETIYIPGKLFSVSQQTAQHVPNLFARNERLVTLFDTEHGPMALILVGAMLVGSIQTVWHGQTNTKTIAKESFGGSLALAKGQEMGHFQMGSTVIVLFTKGSAEWINELHENSAVKLGQLIGHAKFLT